MDAEHSGKLLDRDETGKASRLEPGKRGGNRAVNGAAVIKYVILCVVYIIIFMGALLMVELIEGRKITTTEYMGLTNMGGGYVILAFFFTVILYVLAVLPLTLVVNRWLRHPLLQGVLFTGLAIWAGQFQYRSYEFFIEGYGVQPWTSWWVFGTAGILYTAANVWLTRLADRQRDV
ncbi:hypothetical protein CGZ75_18520 [Paenibacillus herberti]|uniref:Uncharacterized protein n=2 Tax=Paenibacillus herberti TaxID=1619309 RepID=A0A229NYL8_9BACL|nr:hypothetical protein CGZ75_18520 [Paenibacillus herberti]